MLLVDFINVGYGDAILLRETETPFAMLVDCGDARIGRSRPDGRRITAADYLRREGIRELDLLVLTHLHLDHAGGLTHLLPGVRCGNSGPTTSRRRRCGGHTLPAVPGAPAGARCLMTSMGIYVKALAHLRSQKTEIRLIRTPCDCRRLTETLSAGVFWRMKNSGCGRLPSGTPSFLARAAAGTWRRLTALSTTPVSACGYPMPGRRLSCRGMCIPPAGSGTSSRPAPS